MWFHRGFPEHVNLDASIVPQAGGFPNTNGHAGTGRFNGLSLKKS
jgi:hypothetical protein